MQGLVNSATPVSGTPTTATASATPLNGHASMGTGTLGGKPKYGAAAFGFGRNGENGSPIGSESRVHGLSGPAGSSDSSSQEGAGDKRVEPVSKKETNKGTATVDVADDNVTVRLNELSRSEDQPGASAGDSGREVKL